MEKAYFIFKMTGAAMVQPASSDFWKAPLQYQEAKLIYCGSNFPLLQILFFIVLNSTSLWHITVYPKSKENLLNRSKGLKLYSGTSIQGTRSGPRQVSIE